MGSELFTPENSSDPFSVSHYTAAAQIAAMVGSGGSGGSVGGSGDAVPIHSESSNPNCPPTLGVRQHHDAIAPLPQQIIAYRQPDPSQRRKNEQSPIGPS
jgi:hypothetical protein